MNLINFKQLLTKMLKKKIFNKQKLIKILKMKYRNKQIIFK